jgi:recombination protein RecA
MAKQSQDLKGALDQIRKTFGAGAIIDMADGRAREIEGISTGALSLDIALGGKGLPRGRVVEIFGPESSGKTTVALHAVANAQKSGGVAAFIDAEHAFDPTWAKRLGVDLESLLVSQPSFAEEGLKIAEMLVKSNAVDIIVIDSVAALVPEAEVKGEIGDSHVGIQARLMSQTLRILTPLLSRSKCVLIFINQIRQKIGVMFGSNETTSGGLALKFYSSVRLDVRKVGQVKDAETVIGSEVKVKVVKNKVAPPFRQAEFELLFDRGISRESDILNLALKNNIIVRSGNYFVYGEERLALGEKKTKEHLREHPELMDEIGQKVLEARGLVGDGTVDPGEAVIEGSEETEETEVVEKVEKPARRGRGQQTATPASEE